MDYLLEKLESLDRKIVAEEKELIKLQKLIGKKMQKVSDLKKERTAASEAYRESLNQEQLKEA